MFISIYKHIIICYSMFNIEDIKDINDINDIEDIEDIKDIKDINDIEDITSEFIIFFNNIYTKESIYKFQKYIQKKYKKTLSNCDFIKIYNKLDLKDLDLKKLITKKKQKSNSGVLVITVLTSAHPDYIDNNGIKKIAKFSCKHNCAYCPNEKGHDGNNFVDQPRSYLFSEPAVLRANRNNFDAILQFNSRVSTLIEMGHIADKLEIIVLGGTWSEYPRNYQIRFITELYYAANIFFDVEKRTMKSLDQEIIINEKSNIHIIGLTLETRPDTINIEEIKWFRKFNCTRVQLGVQHTHNDVLLKINRGHNIECVYDAIKLLKENCYKVDIHIMPNLPGSSYEKDKAMLNDILYDSRLQSDQYKIYPTAIVPWTKIKEWFEDGKYKPYDDLLLYDLIKDFKQKIQKSKRLNRIIRDIPSTYISGGYRTQFVNMRQLLQNDMKTNNWKCNCIRCREVKDNIVNIEDIRLKIEISEASDGLEYFISFETEHYIIAFIRLRFNAKLNNCLDILKNCGLIRELHVYSNLNNVGNNLTDSYQHKGYGRKLIEKAEEIVKERGLNQIAIISGTGVRDYYRKIGYILIESYMIKQI